MTEAQWLACADPMPMLEFLRGKASARKLRLFACACCRSAHYPVKPPRAELTLAIDAAERFADDRSALKELWAAGSWTRSTTPRREDPFCDDPYFLALRASGNVGALPTIGQILDDWQKALAHLLTSESVRPLEVANQARAPAGDPAAEHATQANLLRDVLNPFRSVRLEPGWLTLNVVELARTVYEERAFERLPILADALMDAGCADDQLLDHLRSPGPHVRGCWALDLILDKS